MINFHGEHKTKYFFEGWYLKHQTQQDMISFIPAFHIDQEGKRSASIQIITKEGSFVKYYDENAFIVSKNKFGCRIDNNIFSKRGICVKIAAEGLSVEGKLYYNEFTPLQSDIMGPFRKIPFMKCNHGIVSLTHSIEGSLTINNEEIDFSKGTGYIEKDWGASFPCAYLWSQTNWEDNGACCVMLSIADIPFLITNFTGCIGVVFYRGKEYRFATYKGVRILKYTNKEVIIEQNDLRLRLNIIEENKFPLQAPDYGNMTRQIHESPVCTIRYQFWKKGKLIFDKISKKASFEYVDDTI